MKTAYGSSLALSKGRVFQV